MDNGIPLIDEGILGYANDDAIAGSFHLGADIAEDIDNHAEFVTLLNRLAQLDLKE